MLLAPETLVGTRFSGELANALMNYHVEVDDERCFCTEVMPRHLLSSNCCSSLSFAPWPHPDLMSVLVHGRLLLMRMHVFAG